MADCPLLSPPVECRQCEGIGGSRGVFATVDVPAGTVLLAEEPLLKVPRDEARPDEDWHVTVARRLLQILRGLGPCDGDAAADAANVQSCQTVLNTWYPRSLAALPAETLAEARETLGTTAASLASDCRRRSALPAGSAGPGGTAASAAPAAAATLAAAAASAARAGAAALLAGDDAEDVAAAAAEDEEEEALRVLLQVRMNAFESGLYANLALVNHSCFPNCVKFGPGERSTGEASSNVWCPRSEIVAVRAIRAGEEVSISFLGCLERSAAARRRLFRKQHLVELEALVDADASGAAQVALEALLPEVAAPADWLLELEAWLDEEELQSSSDCSAFPSRVLDDLLTREEEAGKLLGPCHLVLCRIRRRIANVVKSMLDVKRSCKPASVLPERRTNVQLAELLVRVSLQVRDAQSLYLPTTHLQMADVAEDLAVGISALLGRDRGRLFAAFPKQFPDFQAASGAESALQREAAAIRALYGAVFGVEGSVSSALAQPREPVVEVTVPRVVLGIAQPVDATLGKKRSYSPEKCVEQASEEWGIFD